MHQKYLHLCSEDEGRSYGFGTTWGWVINDIIFILGELLFFIGANTLKMDLIKLKAALQVKSLLIWSHADQVQQWNMMMMLSHTHLLQWIRHFHENILGKHTEQCHTNRHRQVRVRKADSYSLYQWKSHSTPYRKLHLSCSAKFMLFSKLTKWKYVKTHFRHKQI